MARIVTYNIQYCKGLDGIVDIERIAESVADADIIAFQEIDRFWPRTDNVDQLARLVELLPGYYHVFGAGVDLHLSGEPAEGNRRRQFGNAIFSKFPILSSRHHLLPKRGSIGPLSIQRSATEATIMCNEIKLRIYSLHLTHLSSETRLPQLKHLMKIHRNATTEGAPINGDLTGFDWQQGVESQDVPDNAIFLGDFNFQPDSPEYLYFVGPVNDYGGHITPATGFVDAWCQAGHEKHTGATSDVNDVPARLDYAFVSSPIRHRIKKCIVDNQAMGSDHKPLWLEMDI